MQKSLKSKLCQNFELSFYLAISTFMLYMTYRLFFGNIPITDSVASKIAIISIFIFIMNLVALINSAYEFIESIIRKDKKETVGRLDKNMNNFLYYLCTSSMLTMFLWVQDQHKGDYLLLGFIVFALIFYLLHNYLNTKTQIRVQEKLRNI